MNGFGSSVSPQLIEMLARRLLQRYQRSTPESTHPPISVEQLEQGIKSLLEEHILVMGTATEVSDYRDDLLDLVVKAVKNAQLQSGTLASLGILDQPTLMWLRHRPFGHFHRPHQSLAKSTTVSSPGISKFVGYYIENDGLPFVHGLSEIEVLRGFVEAWYSWSQVCNIEVKQIGDRAAANVIINCQSNEHSNNILAMVDLGPPGDRQLELRFHVSFWTRHKFLATAGHQIGHLLGIESISIPGQLMNETLHDDIRIPQSLDIAEAARIWGER